MTFLTIAPTVSSSLGSPVVVVSSRSATPRYRLLSSCSSNAARSSSVLRLRKAFGTAAVVVVEPFPDPPAAAESFAAINPGTDELGTVRRLEIGTGICEEVEEDDPPLEGIGEAVPEVRFDELDEADGVRRC